MATKTLKIGTNPQLRPMYSICIGCSAYAMGGGRPWYLCDGCGNEVRDYSEYETRNGYAPVIHFRTRAQAEKFAEQIPPPPGCQWRDATFPETRCPDVMASTVDVQ